MNARDSITSGIVQTLCVVVHRLLVKDDSFGCRGNPLHWIVLYTDLLVQNFRSQCVMYDLKCT